MTTNIVEQITTVNLDTQIYKSSKINLIGNVKFLRLLSQGNIERLGRFQLSLLGNNGLALDFSDFGQALYLDSHINSALLTKIMKSPFLPY